MKQNRFPKDKTGFISPYRAKLNERALKGDPYSSEKLSDIRRAVAKNRIAKAAKKPHPGLGP